MGLARARDADPLHRLSVPGARERVLINFVYAQQVGHAIDYFRALLRAHGGDASAIWSLDGIHADYV